MSKPHDRSISFNLILSSKLISLTGAGSNADAPPLTNIITTSLSVAFSNLEITSFAAINPFLQGTGCDAPITLHPFKSIIFSKFVTASALEFAFFGNIFKKQLAILHAALPIDIIIYLPSFEITGIGLCFNDLDNAFSGSAAFMPSINAL